MKIDTHLDLDVVAMEQEDQVTVMLELTAPPAPGSAPRSPATVQVVLDRSGSMGGERLEAATRAVAALTDRLDADDRLGVVAFDDQVQVVVPAGPVVNKAAIRHAVRGIRPGGMTNLSAGYLRGVQEARRVAGPAGASVLLLSDGHANAGVVDVDQLSSVAANAHAGGVTTSTIGIGLDYDETLLAGVARGGQGGHAFALDGDAAGSAVAGEVEGLLSKTVQAASLIVRPRGPVESVTVWNDLPSEPIEGGIMIELGDLWAGEQRKLLLTFAVPAMGALGLEQIASLELRSVAVPEFVEQTVTVPVHVNVVPGDQAAGRVPNPVVRTELLFQQAQEAKRQAADAIARGDDDEAYRLYGVAFQSIDACAPSPGDELAEESIILKSLAAESRAHSRLAAKRSRMEQAAKARKRGRG